MISHLVPSDPIASNMSPNAMSDPAAVAAYKAHIPHTLLPLAFWLVDTDILEIDFLYFVIVNAL
jgi:hypothetical protein